MTEALRIWKLTPITTDDPLWRGSSHLGAVIVRARDEENARAQAQEQFGVSARFSARARIVGAPWKRPNLVRAQLLEHSPYSTDGSLGVLEPSFATDLAARPPPQGRQ
jgi:hypothetical protein